MNTKKQDQKKNPRQKTRRQQGSKKHNQHMLHDVLTHHEQESPETRLTR